MGYVDNTIRAWDALKVGLWLLYPFTWLPCVFLSAGRAAIVAV